MICLDEAGQFVIPLLSGHLGGANDLARKIAHQCGATPVITTATDVNHLFAVDLWAKKQQLAIINTPRIKAVSAKILAGEVVTVSCPWPVAGEPPELVALGSAEDVSVTFRRVPEDVLAARREKLELPECPAQKGWLARYAKLVSSANKGAIVE